MSEQKETQTTVYECNIRFPSALKTEERDSIFTKFNSFIQENREAFTAKIKLRKRIKQILFDSDNFMLIITLAKRMSFRAVINDPDKNKADINEIGNKIVSYMNTILSEKAVGAVVTSSITVRSTKTYDLAKKIVGENKIAKIGDLLRQTIQPISVAFEYKVGEKDFYVSSLTSGGQTLEICGSHTVYKDKLPFNLIEREISELDHPIQIVKKLIEMEL
ncbi:MAG TPA: hypothetical protein VIH48_05025 [Candidatus Bathyarchaeia archaeon]